MAKDKPLTENASDKSLPITANTKSLTKVEMLSLELLIAVAKQNKRAPGHVMVNKEEQAQGIADWRMQRAGGFTLSEINRKTNPQVLRVSKQLEVNPTLQELMDLQAEASKQQR